MHNKCPVYLLKNWKKTDNIMRKNIDIPDEIVQDLKILAVKADKDLKNFIQDELVYLVEKSKQKL
jgi:hypothetical protein